MRSLRASNCHEVLCSCSHLCLCHGKYAHLGSRDMQKIHAPCKSLMLLSQVNCAQRIKASRSKIDLRNEPIIRWYSVTLPRMPWVANVRLKVNPIADASTLQGNSAPCIFFSSDDLPASASQAIDKLHNCSRDMLCAFHTVLSRGYEKETTSLVYAF